MNAMRMNIALVWLTGLLPGWRRHRMPIDFVAASRSQQAQLLTQWAAAPQAARLPLLRALQKENLVMDTENMLSAPDRADYSPLGAVRARGPNQTGASDQPPAQSGRRAGHASAGK
jgi:urea transport system permease protein